jgi:hypothetical protein
MAKQEIDIGVEGNDGTGDSIRESFKKVNENFQELYAVFGLGGQISFTNLNDTPSSTSGEEGKVVLVKQDGTGLDFFELVSDAGNADPNDPDNTVAFNIDGDKLRIRVINVNIETDPSPTISNPMKMGAALAYGETTHEKVLVDSERQLLIDNWNAVHDDPPLIDEDNILISKGLSDRKYMPKEAAGMGARIKDEPASVAAYTLTIDDFAGQGSPLVEIADHGLTEAVTGAPYIYNSTITDGTNLTTGTTYYVRREDSNNITLHPTQNDALSNTNAILPDFGVGVQTLVDAAYDADLAGNWLDNVALPRKSVVRREGDSMTGALFAHDHPAPYEGAGIVNDASDLQVATKYYVDAQQATLSENIYVSLRGTDDHSSTPAGREGRSETYAFRSVYAAMAKAKRIQDASDIDIGPYIQTMTYNESLTEYNAYVTDPGDLGFTTSGDQTVVVNTIDTELRDIIDETIAQVAVVFPTFVYNESICRRDLELIINAIKLDIAGSSSLVKQNRLSRIAGLKYFANPSGEIAIDNNGQYQQTSYALTYAKNLMLTALTAASVTNGNPWYGAVEDNWDVVLDTINQNTPDPALVEAANYYNLYIHSGANGFVDQAGDPAAGTPNVDIFPGKVIRGKRSGAIGTIVSYTRGADNGGINYDTVEIDLLEPTEFLENEELEYGAFVKKKQISVRVESGTYEEQLPIRLPENISIKGDEFRRTVIRPAPGPSLSDHANVWFYRDETIDGLTTATGGTDEWIDDLTGLRRGYFGYHYLTDPANPVDISDFGKDNKGNYGEAADLVRFNKDFIVEEVIAYITATYPALVYDATVYRAQIGFLVDGLVKDLNRGGRSYSAENQKTYSTKAEFVGKETETTAGVLHIKGMITNILANDSADPYTVTAGNTETQVFNTNYEAETGADTQALELVDLVAYGFDADYNPAKDNNEMDVFLCGDNTIVRNLTVQRHGGFMMVLDPEGSVRTRSPYAQTNTSFARSLNKKAFHGGMFIDGYTYNMPMTITSKVDLFTVNVEAPIGSGLNIRKPELPCSFFEFGRRYQVNAIRNYTTGVSEIDGVTTVQKATLVLDLGSHDGIGFDDDIDSAAGPVDIILQGAGNKSMLANDFTQINDLGYGVLANNNALSELVSVFTYYCHTGYLSLNGSQIRSLTGNNSYGFYGLVSEGSDPDEVATKIDLEQDLTQPVKMFAADQIVTLTGTGLGIVRDDIIQQLSTITGNTAQGRVVFAYEESGNTVVWVTRYIDAINLYEYTFNDADTVTDDTTPTPVSYGAPVDVSTLSTKGAAGQSFAFIFDCTNYPMNGSQLEIHHADTDLSFQPYEVVSVSETEFEIPAAYAGDLGSANTDINAKVYRLDFTSGTGGDVATESTGLRFNVDYATNAIMTAQQNLLLNGVSSEVLTRPSTALIFDEQEQVTYRTLSFETTIVGAVQVSGVQARCTIDDNFDYVDLTVINDFADHAIAAYGLTGGTTLGRTVGDQHIAVNKLSTADAARVNSTTIDMIFTWNGRVHVASAYTDVTDAVDGTGAAFGIITITDKYDIVSAGGSGLVARVDSAAGNNITLQLGLQEAEKGNVTVNISTCRATSHDFLDIGTGGYNTTNYPDRILGAPIERAVTDEQSIDSEGLASKAQVQERKRGRCFFASTDQDGFFRVGRFFTVDQGTGRITFNAALVLTNIDGIGFKRGVRVNEFSADDTFTNATADAVPVETAVEGYINRRLGWNRDGNLLGDADIIPASTGGALALSGVTTMRGDLRMGGFNILNLDAPTNGTDAANKNYVDAQVARYDTFEEMEDTNIDDTTALANNQFAIYDSGISRWINSGFDTGDNGASPAVPNSDFIITKDGSGNLIGSYQPNSIVNADVKSDAAIAQSKLNMNAATTRANATGITQADLGLASFHNTQFDATDGWIELKDLGVVNAKIADSTIANAKLANQGTTFADGGGTSSQVDLGETLTIQGTANEITVSYNGAGTYTLGLTATFETDIVGDIYTNVSNPHRVLDNGVWNGSAYTTLPSFEGWSQYAKQLETGATATNATHYLTFVDSNNTTRTWETVYTDAGVSYNPSTNQLTVSGEMQAGSADINGVMNITGNIIPNSGTPTNQNIGSSSNRWGTVYAQTFNGVATEALYADLAENYLGDAAYEPGTVLVFGGEAEVTVGNTKGDTRVAGVVTTNPAHLMNSHLKGEHVVGVALQGRVPCKVLGKVRKGDMLVTSAKAGYAIVNNSPGVGQVIGKAVGDKTDDGYGTVEVVVGRV